MDKTKVHEYINNFLKSGEFYLDDEEIDVRSYSGRGMYGNSCLGITCDNPVKVQGELVAELMLQIVDEATDIEDEGESIRLAIEFADDVKVELISRVKTDSMGTQSIIYWENIPYIK